MNEDAINAIVDAKERKKARRALRKMQEGKIEQPIDNRKSIFDGRYPGSVEEDWTKYDGLGWVHKLESMSFTQGCRKCSVTDRYFFKKDLLTTSRGTYICKAEADANWKLCPMLHAYVQKVDFVEARDRDGEKIMISPEALEHKCFKCDFSGDYYLRDYRMKIRGSEKYKFIASRFFDENFTQCGSCGENYEAVRVKEHEELPGAKLCEICFNKQQFKNVIHPHNHAGYPKPIATPKERYGHRIVDGMVFATKKKESYSEVRLFGVEVETEMNMAGCKKDGLTRHHMALNLMGALGKDFVMCKEDGTLTMNGKYSGGELDPKGTGPTYAGFEVVSAPADITAHRERWPRLEKAEGYRHLRAWDTETCGFHVHVTREALTYLQIARMLIFVNHPKNTLFIQKVAGRGSAKFCRYVEKEPKDALRVDPRTDDNRRQAINLCNANTIEFRIFRGTVNPKHILRNIEFCDAICDFAYPGSRSIKEMKDFKFFIKFVDSNRKKWPLLAAWFAMHKIIQLKAAGKKAEREKLTLKIDDVAESEIMVKANGEDVRKPKKDEPEAIARPVRARVGVAERDADPDGDDE